MVIEQQHDASETIIAFWRSREGKSHRIEANLPMHAAEEFAFFGGRFPKDPTIARIWIKGEINIKTMIKRHVKDPF